LGWNSIEHAGSWSVVMLEQDVAHTHTHTAVGVQSSQTVLRRSLSSATVDVKDKCVGLE
jgi:hypothetical protein